MARKIKKWFLIALLVLFVLAGVGVLLGILYEDEVKQRIVREVNQGLNTEISVESISFSVIQKFPYASLEFNNMMALDAIETTAPKDTLLYAGSFFLEFNLLDLFRGNYTIRKVEIANAVLRLKVDENGKDNFHFWKERSDTTSAEIAFQLEAVAFKRVDFSYRNVQNGFHLDTDIDYLNLSGNFHEAVFDLDVQSRLLLETLELDEDRYLHNRDTRIASRIKIDTGRNHFAIAEGSVRLDGMQFLANGSFQAGDAQHLDLRLDGQQLDILDVLNLIPKKLLEPLEGYEPRGRTSFGLHLLGDPSDPAKPMEVQASFNVQNAGVKHLKSGLNFKNFEATGTFHHRANHPDLLEIDNFRFQLKEGTLSGNGSIRNFSRPMIQFELNGKANLDDLQEIIEIRSLEYIRGGVNLTCRFKGIIANPQKLSVADLKRAEISGRLEFDNTDFKIAGADHKYHGFTGAFHLNGNHAAVKNLRGNIFSSDFALDGVFENFVPFVLIEGEKMNIQASLESSFIDLAELLLADKESEGDELHFQLPKYVELNANASIKKLQFRTFRADNIRGLVDITPSGIFADKLTFGTSEGTFDAKMDVRPHAGNRFKVNAQAQLRSINIQQLFTEFDNFGQDFLTDKHLRGKTDADVVFRTTLNSALQLDPASIYSLVDISIVNGELIQHQALIEVADYIRQNRILSPLIRTDRLRERLQHVHFSRLENQIEIRDRTIHIPEMNLESSAMNLVAAGTHHFNSVVDYRLRFRLAEILTNPQHSEFGEIRDDGSGGSFFLRMSGPLDDLQFAYDRQSARDQRRAYFQQEKENFRNLLRKEFGGLFGGRRNREETPAPPPQRTEEVIIEHGASPQQQQSQQGQQTQPAEPQPAKPPVITISPAGEKDEHNDFWDELEEDDDF